MNKFYLTLRYVFFLPISIVLSLLISGLVSITQNFMNMIFCKLAILNIPFITCNSNFESRTFLAELVGLCILLLGCYKIAPNHKNLITGIVALLSSCMYLFSLVVYFMQNNFDKLLDTSVFLIITLIVAILLFKNKINLD